ncbi:tyrosine-type recombinase/integrase [Corynebacterium diphtheriae bv. mitis]|nr:tyrosine-type recombinase/integrase [Corynebacterium diphtheriae bv. mitis]
MWTNRRGQIVTTPSRRSWWHSAVDVCHEADDSFPAGLRIHDLRHTAASLLIGAGASVLVVQRQLGHASAKMTLDRYSHLFDGDLDEVVGAISDVVGLSWDSVNDGGLSSSAG